MTISWLMGIGLIADTRNCHICKKEMSLSPCQDRKDGFRWECRRSIAGKKHRFERSIREGSWFERANLSITEVLKFSYWWCVGLNQMQIKAQLAMSPSTLVDWDMFCRELCGVVLSDENEIIGGPGKIVQIDESKIGKRKYHKGHFVEGQWVFGGIEEDSRKSFIVCVENRKEDTLIPLMHRWIHLGTTIYSDCWKGYINVAHHGYLHGTVNHNKEFVSEDGVHTNKIKGHWCQMKANLPTHGRKRAHYDSYIAEFI